MTDMSGCLRNIKLNRLFGDGHSDLLEMPAEMRSTYVELKLGHKY